jgi:hypothetical protein
MVEVMKTRSSSLISLVLAAAFVSVAGCSVGAHEDPDVGSTASLLQGPLSLWSDTTLPKVAADSDAAAVELGTKFRVDVAGTVTGVRFYKSLTNTGVHTGHLWSSSGALLASVTFSGERASGWQTAMFSQPVSIVAGATYVISYHTNVGHYAADSAYFAGHGVDNGSLHGLADGASGHNGVYHYGATAFPTDSYQQTNYWVDVLFVPNATTTDAGAPPPPPPADAGAPPPPPASGDPCSVFPSLPAARPSATNTGVPSGTALTASSTITVTTAGSIVDAKNVTGSIFVNANNVTIRNTRVTMNSGWYGIQVADGVTGTKILHSEITTPAGGYTGITMSNGIVCGCNISRWENGMTIGGNMIVQANYVHSLQGGAGAHFDAIEHYSGSNNKVWGNTLLVNNPDGSWMSETGALNVTPTWGPIDNLDVRGNVFGGGSYSLYVREGSAGIYTNVNVQDNRWIRNSALWGPMSVAPNPVKWSGNVWDDNGQAISQ